MNCKMLNRTKNLSNCWKKRIFLLCWFAYAIAYLGRLNFSIAIPRIEESLPFDKTSLGLIGSVYFWVYAFGQLINGRLGDKFSCRNFVFAGLFFSAIFNILFAFSTNPYVMIILWAFNGYSQSMLWGPLMKTINQWFPDREKSKIAIQMSATYLSGFLLAWGGLGQLLSYTDWPGIFWIPGIVLFTYSIIWYAFARDNPGEAGLDYNDVKTSYQDGSEVMEKKAEIKTEIKEKKEFSFLKLISSPGLYLVALAGIPLGFIREGIVLWSPTMLYETFRLDLQSITGAALLIPLFNFIGVIIARLLISRFQNKETSLVLLYFTSGTLACIFLYLLGSRGIITNLTLLALCSSSFYGATSIITSVIPLKYSATSSIAGFLDFSIYLGAGLSGIAAGFLSSRVGWSIVAVTWILAGAIGSLCLFMEGKTRNKRLI